MASVNDSAVARLRTLKAVDLGMVQQTLFWVATRVERITETVTKIEECGVGGGEEGQEVGGQRGSELSFKRGSRFW